MYVKLESEKKKKKLYILEMEKNSGHTFQACIF